MLPHQLTELGGAGPDGVPETLAVLDGFDDTLVGGFARVPDERVAALTALAGAVAGSPLGDRVAEAVEKVVAGSIADEHLVTLAGARTALWGAVHDALLSQLDTVLGRDREEWSPDGSAPGASVPVQAAPNLLAGVRSWLRELAIVGWRGVGHDTVSASGQVLQAVLAEPVLRRLGVLLDGLAAELRACSPVSTMDDVPARRWADLWARALLLAEPGGAAAAAPVDVSGRLLVLGAAVHGHGTAVQVQVHGLLEPAGGGPARLVRTSVTVSRVDTIVGPAVWRLLSGCPVLLGALAERRVLEVADVPLLPSGDLLWDDQRARAGEPADPFATARVGLAGALAPAVPPLQRHPVGIGEPVLVEGYSVAAADGSGELAFGLGDGSIAVDVDRLPSCGPLTRELVAASSACIALVRWDAGRWSLQPLAVQATVKRKPVAVHTADWALGPTDAKAAKAAASAGDAVAVLRERAGRLLRR